MTLFDGSWRIASQGAVNQYHEVVILERGEDRIGVWLPRDQDIDFVVAKAVVLRMNDHPDNPPS